MQVRFLPGAQRGKLLYNETAKEPEEKHRLEPYFNFGGRKFFNHMNQKGDGTQIQTQPICCTQTMRNSIKTFYRQAGFAPIAIIIGVVVVLAAAGGGYWWWQNKAKVAVPVGNQQNKPFEIKELGVELDLPSDLYDLTYIIKGEGINKSALLSTQTLSKGGQYCGASEAPLGGITLSNQGAGDRQQFKTVNSVPAYYFSPQSVCSSDKSIADLQQSQLQSLIKAFAQVQAETANWKTYRNTKYGFEVGYPSSFTFHDSQSTPDSWMITKLREGRVIKPVDCGGFPSQLDEINFGWMVFDRQNSGHLYAIEAIEKRSILQYTQISIGDKSLEVRRSVPGMCGDSDEFIWMEPSGRHIVSFAVNPSNTNLVDEYKAIIASFKFF